MDRGVESATERVKGTEWGLQLQSAQHRRIGGGEVGGWRHHPQLLLSMVRLAYEEFASSIIGAFPTS
jgi:hypothetical protein